MKKKILSFMVTAVLIAATIEMNSVIAFAEEGTGGKATVEGSAQTGSETTPTNGMVVTGDDDDNDGTKTEDDKSGATDINVYAKISGADGDDVIYNIEVTWGSMNFVYDWGGSWDPVNHKYTTSGEAGGSAGAGWITESYVDGTNNKITVTNHSNYPITSGFAYANTLNETKSVFNATPDAAKSVMGIFAENNDTLASGINTDNYNGVQATEAEKAKTAKFDLNTLDITCTVMDSSSDRAGTNTNSIYFSLCGTPDSEATTSSAFEKVGNITVTITPYVKSL